MTNRGKMFTAKDHSYIICAYKESEYLEECIKSLLAQKTKSEIAIATSTPNDLISKLAEKYGLRVYVNNGEKGIAGDWNFAISCAETKLVTIAHQDDVYLPDYTDMMLKYMNRHDNPIIFCCNYGELKNGVVAKASALVLVKKMLSVPMKLWPASQKAKKFAISFGNGICCPSVTYITEIITKYPFKKGMSSNLDWERWEFLSGLPGSFEYCSEALMLHRIHPDAETSRLVGENSRTGEDYEMLKHFHNEKTARLISKFYSIGEETYKK